MKLSIQLPINAAALALLCQLSALAAVAPADIQNAIQKAQILAPGTSMNVRVNNGNVVISTYRSSTNDNDCKIDGVFMARTTMDLAPSDINRVTIYFYSRADLSHYKEVTLTAGDIRAFGAGELKKEQLLSSVALIDHNAQDAVSLSNLIQTSEAMRARNYDVSPPDSKGRVNLSTQLESWVGDSDAKYEALKLASRLLAAAPAGTIKEIHVTFTDPDQASFIREINLKADAVHSVQQKIDADLATLAISAPAVGTAVAAGPMQTERQAVAERIAALEKAGVGVAIYRQLFNTMEHDATTGNAAAVTDELKTLTDALDEQEKARKNIQAMANAKPVAGGPEAKPKRPPHPASITSPLEDRWASGHVVNPDAILRDPAGTVARAFPTPADNDPLYYHFIRYVAQTLYKGGKPDEALQYDLRAYDLETKFPQLKTAGLKTQGAAHR